jgi:hypothetical protein
MLMKLFQNIHFVIVFNIMMKPWCGSLVHKPEAPTRISILTRVTRTTEKLPDGHGVVNFQFHAILFKCVRMMDIGLRDILQGTLLKTWMPFNILTQRIRYVPSTRFTALREEKFAWASTSKGASCNIHFHFTLRCNVVDRHCSLQPEFLAIVRRCIAFPARYELILYMLCRRK